ncbi:Methylphosphotriester-DNA--protein-cysteine S-methyltransferase [Roseibium album]|nr:Methylphosphotriester-DNA--protein-cysteine S-methyltransferase [Roseibium album]
MITRLRLECPARQRYLFFMISTRMPSEHTYEAILHRDPALDGVVFSGVKTTGIYCRPVCKARVPFRKNIALYPSAAAAEAAGFRPCLRCRPETAPFCPAWKGTKTTVERALGLIRSGALESGSVQQLADRLGIGARHLSRLFAEHIGASPKQLAQTLRIQKAKRLIDQTDETLDNIASQSGFGSARRMRATFVALYGRPPSSIRNMRRRKTSTSAKSIHPNIAFQNEGSIA